MVGWKGADVAKGVGHGAAALGLEAGQLGHGSADLLALIGRKALHCFGAGEDALPLGGRHVIELSEAVAHALLDLGREVAEARFTLKGALLVGKGEVAVTIHPFGEVLVPLRISAWVGRRSGAATRAGLRADREGEGERQHSTREGALQVPGCVAGLHKANLEIAGAAVWAAVSGPDESTGSLVFFLLL